jgi:uncharacterized iron-regulated membrane protein
VTWIKRREPGAPGQYYPGPIRHTEHIILIFIGIPTGLFLAVVLFYRFLKVIGVVPS